MSRSHSSSTRDSGAAYDRDYDDRKDRERDRIRSADRYDGEGRHHGKWTAASETTDLETSGSSAPGAYSDARRSQNLGHRSYSDRENYDYNSSSRSRGSVGSGNYPGSYGNYNSYDNYPYQGGYSSMAPPPPPPMPPMDFYAPHGQYRSSHPYNPRYGHMSYDGIDLSGAQGISHGGYGGFGHSGFGGFGGHQAGYGSRDLYSSGDYFGESTTPYGWFHPSQGQGQSYHPAQSYHPSQSFNNDLYYTELSRSALPSATVVPGAHISGNGAPRHLELGTTRPHVDIYELGNEYIIEMDLPGHSREHIETKLFGNELLVVSKPPKRDFNYHINERPLGRHEVTRKFYLPADVAGNKINASLTNGVLRLTLPRAAAQSTTPSTTPSTTTVVDTTASTTTTTQTGV